MAMTTEDLLIDISVNSQQANKSLVDLQKQLDGVAQSLNKSGDSMKKTEQAVSGLGATIIVLNEGLELAKKAWEMISEPVIAAVEAYAEFQGASNRLGISLKLTNQYTENHVKSFEQFAEQLERVSNVSKVAVLDLAAIGKQTGLSDNQTKKLIETSANLAALTHKDLHSAFNELLGQYGGMPGRIEKIIPALAGFTEAQLRAGKGIDYLADRLKGLASEDAKSIEGSIKSMAFAWDDFKEASGKAINSLVDIPGLMKTVKDAMNGVTELIDEWNPKFQAIGKVITAVGDVSEIEFLRMSTGIARAMELIAISVGMIFEKVNKLTGIGGSVAEYFNQVQENAKKSGDDFSKRIDDLVKHMEDSIGAVPDLWNQVGESTVGATESAKDYADQQDLILYNVREQLKVIDELSLANTSLAAQVNSYGKNEEDQLKIQIELELEKLELKRKQLETEGKLGGAEGAKIRGLIDQQKALLEQKGSNEMVELVLKNVDPLAKAIAEGTRDAANFINDSITNFNTAFGTDLDTFSSEFINSATEVTAKVSNGFIKAFDVMGDIFNGFVEGLGTAFEIIKKVFDPDTYKGISDKIQNIVSNLPQRLKGAMDGLIKGIDTLMKNAPQIVSGLADALDRFISQIMKRLPEIFKTIEDNMDKMFERGGKILPTLLGKILDQIPQFIQRSMAQLSNQVSNILPQLTGKIFKAIPKIFDAILSEMPRAFEAIAHALPIIIRQLLGMITGLLRVLMKRLPDIVESLIEQVLGMIGSIVAAFIDWIIKDFPTLIGEFMKFIPRIVWAIVKGIVVGLSMMVKNLFSGVKAQGFEDQIKSIPDAISKGAKQAAKFFTNQSSQLFKVQDFGEGTKKITDPLKEEADKFMDMLNEALDAIKGIFGWLKDLWMWIYNVFGKLFETLGEWFEKARVWFENMFTAFKEMWITVRSIFESIIQKFKDMFSTVRSWFDSIVEKIRAVWDNVFSWFNSFKDMISSAWSGVMDFFKNFSFDGAFSGIKGFLNNFQMPEFKMPKWMDDFIDSITGFFKMPKWMSDFIDALKHPGSVLGGGGGGGNGGVLGKATGGILSGGGLVGPGFYAASGALVPQGTDTVMGMLTPGEFVLRRSAVNALGLGAVSQLNQAGMKGGSQGVNVVNMSINVKIDASAQSLDENYVRNRLMPAIKSEIKKATYSGELLVNQRGVVKT